MKNKELLIEELEVTGVSQVLELINDVAEVVISEPKEELPITESEVDIEAMTMDDLFEKGKADTKIKVEAKIREKQPQLSRLTPEERAMEIRKITLAYWEEFQAKYLTKEALSKYIDDNWDSILAEVKRRKELKKQDEQLANESQPEPQIEVLTPIVEQVKVEEIKAEIKPIVESNSILDFNDYEFKEKYQKYYIEEMPPLDKIEIIDNGEEFKSTDKRLSIKLPNGLVLHEKDRTTNKNPNVMLWYIWDEAHKTNKTDTIDYASKNTIKNEIFSQYFITKTRIEISEGTYEINQPEISTHVSLPVETKDEILPNGNTVRTYLEEDGMRVEMNPNKEVVSVNGIELDFGWFNKCNVLKRFSPDDFVRSEYYREQIKLKEEKEEDELIPDFTKLRVEKKEEIQLPSFAMDLSTGI